MTDAETIQRLRAEWSQQLRRAIVAEEKAARAESLLTQLCDGRDLRRAEHVRTLGEKVRKLRLQSRSMQVSAEERNRRVWATGLIVNCTGCDAGGPFGGNELTEDRVREVEQIARRLRTWFVNHKSRATLAAKFDANAPTPGQETS